MNTPHKYRSIEQCIGDQESSAAYTVEAMYYLEHRILQAARKNQRLAAAYHHAMWNELKYLIKELDQ